MARGKRYTAVQAIQSLPKADASIGQGVGLKEASR